MRIWGYILVLLNIAATGAFVYFATAVWKSRSEWQYALLKQELVNRGLPVEAPKNPEPVDEEFVPFEFQYGVSAISQISKKQLNQLIPSGGDVLGLKGGPPVTSQTDEVKRVEKIVFGDLDGLSRKEKRLRLMILLVNLAQGNGREGAFALLRDMPIEKRRVLARRELAFLGTSAPQTSALQALNAVGEANIGLGPNRPKEEANSRSQAARRALLAWALSEVPNITPDPLPTSPRIGEAANLPPANPERDRLIEVLQAIRVEMDKPTPDPVQLEAGKERLKGLLAGDAPLVSANAPLLLPFLIDVGTNLLDDQDKVNLAKAKLVELLLSRATTEAEKKALLAIAELLMPPRLEDEAKAAEQLETNIDTAAIEQLRAYFEDATAPPSANDLPENVADARTKLLGLKPIRDAGQKRRAIAHLLYHLDALVGVSKESRDIWYRTFVDGDSKAVPADESYLMRPADEAYLKNRKLWHQRVAAVVGLKDYVLVVEAQATRLNKIRWEIDARIKQEQGVFEKEYGDIVDYTVKMAIDLEIVLGEKKDKEKNREDAARQLAARLVELKDLEDKLVATTAQTKKVLQALDVKVDELFQITQVLGDAQDALVVLEAKLRALELGPTSRTKIGNE